VSEFGEIVEASKIFFSSLFKAPTGCPISEILKFIILFHKSMTKEMNVSLLFEILEKEIFDTLSSFQKCKIPRLDGLTVELYLGFYELIKGDLLKVAKKSQRTCKIWGSLNSTFLTLILKKKDPSSFEDLRPISYCNLIYKLFANIIANHINPISSEIIYEEQYDFLFK
jgi:hypothetical protein